MGQTGQIVVAALVVAPGPEGTITFVRQQRGAYAGWWLLPGGKVEYGEPIANAARREAAEESGCKVDRLTVVGAYEICGSNPDHHFLMWAYCSDEVAPVSRRFTGHHVGEVCQVLWDEIEPHPTDMPILNDAGVAAYPVEAINECLAAEGIAMVNTLTGVSYGIPRATATVPVV